MDMEINFPNLGIYLDHVGKNISIFGFSIAYYGIVIVTGMMIAIWIAQREAKRTGQNPEQYLDLAMIGIAAGILGARIYYVIFAWDYYKDDLLSIFNIRQGGLAIYGGIIGACIAVVIYSRKKKQNFSLLMDTASMSIVFGQIMGRWGNFFNREAFGDYTNNLFAMQLPVSAVRANEITQKMWDHVVTVNGVEYIQVHPTFLYESLWNVGVLLFLFWFRKRKKFNGEVFLMYLIGRPWKNLDRGTPHRPASASGGGTSGFPAPFGVPCGGMYHLGGMETKKIIIRWGDSPFLRIKPVKKTE